MSSEPMRDPETDPLLTPANSALIVIDYQPSQVATVTSIDRDLLSRNIVTVARLAKTYRLPIVLSTVNVANGQGRTIPELKEVLAGDVEIDRSQINSWEDVDLRRAVEATGRKKLIMTACGPRCAWPSPPSTPSALATRCTPSSMPWAEPISKHTEPGSNASSKPGRSRSVGYRWRVSCSVTGRAPRPSPRSSTLS
jgi:hypothetical protein